MKYTIKVTRTVFAEDEAQAVFSFKDAMKRSDFGIDEVEIIKTEDENEDEVCSACKGEDIEGCEYCDVEGK